MMNQHNKMVMVMTVRGPGRRLWAGLRDWVLRKMVMNMLNGGNKMVMMMMNLSSPMVVMLENGWR